MNTDVPFALDGEVTEAAFPDTPLDTEETERPEALPAPEELLPILAKAGAPDPFAFLLGLIHAAESLTGGRLREDSKLAEVCREYISNDQVRARIADLVTRTRERLERQERDRCRRALERRGYLSRRDLGKVDD